MNMCASTIKANVFWRLVGAIFPSLVVDNEHYSKLYPLSHHISRLVEEMGYLHIQASKPDTLGIVSQLI